MRHNYEMTAMLKRTDGLDLYSLGDIVYILVEECNSKHSGEMNPYECSAGRVTEMVKYTKPKVTLMNKWSRPWLDLFENEQLEWGIVHK